MTTKKSRTKKGLGRGQIQRLNKRLSIMRGERKELPQVGAAELAAHMRSYGLKAWEGVTLGEADRFANSVLFFSETYYGGRHWRSAYGTPDWTSGNRLLVLFTPSIERALVLRLHSYPSWPDVNANVGMNILPRHPRRDHESPQFETHWHRLPQDVPPWAISQQSWDGCCGKRAVSRELAKPVIDLAKAHGSIAALRDLMVDVWQKVHGPARPCWVTAAEDKVVGN